MRPTTTEGADDVVKYGSRWGREREKGNGQRIDGVRCGKVREMWKEGKKEEKKETNLVVRCERLSFVTSIM